MFSFAKKVLFGAAMVLVLNMGVGVSIPFAHAATGDGSYEDISSQGIIFAGICTGGVGSACACRDTGDCTLNDVLQLFVNASNFILGIVGSAVLFVFVYGGFKWLLSRGDSHWIEEGRKAMTAGAVGLVIVFGSYAALNFIISGLISDDNSTPESLKLEQTIQNTGISTDDVFTTQP